jgi:hypothetical protein
LYTGVNDTTRLESDRGLDLNPKELDIMLGKLSPDPISLNFNIPPVSCVPICLDQATRPKLLREVPKLDNIDIAAPQTGDQSCGVHIPETDATSG